MILEPGILALLSSSILISIMVLFAAGNGVVLLRRWDLASGSELQLALERRTYLIATVTGYVLAYEVASLLLFIHTADSISHLFVGAMCAVGTLSANGSGYAALLLKVITCILSGLWLILNHADNEGCDYPLIRPKYRLLLVMAPLILAGTVTQAIYFARLRPDLITSCCGTLFSEGSDIAALPAPPTAIIFHLCIAATLAAGARFLAKGRGGYLYAALSGVTFAVSIVSIVSFISLYIYEMPSHHCPFCMLQREYGYIGYPLYLALFTGVVAGLGVGVLHPFRFIESIERVIPLMQRKLTAVSVSSFTLFAAIVSYRILSSTFRIA